ncbi:MAG TPA: hypothetical protein VEX36_03335 [Thermoleophilaceae bacterium]|nr:hypothetical protein [Thermoleophilaceae bacterium]
MTTADAHGGRLAGLLETWSRLHVEQRVAAVAAALLIVSTLGPFSFVEAAEILAAGAVLLLLKQRADGRAFHLPFGDGTAVFAAGIWCGVLIATRIFDRPPGMTVLALVCALLLAAAGLRERAKRAPDDLPEGLVRMPPEPSGTPMVSGRGQPAAPAPGSAVPIPPEGSATAPRSTAAATAKPSGGKPKRPKRSDPEPEATRQLSLDEDVTTSLSDGSAEPPAEPER